MTGVVIQRIELMTDLQVLLGTEICVHASEGHKLIVLTLLKHLAVLGKQDEIGVLNCTRLMGNHNRGSARASFVQGLLDQLLRLEIQGRSGLVQQQDLWVAKSRRGQS